MEGREGKERGKENRKGEEGMLLVRGSKGLMGPLEVQGERQKGR